MPPSKAGKRLRRLRARMDWPAIAVVRQRPCRSSLINHVRGAEANDQARLAKEPITNWQGPDRSGAIPSAKDDIRGASEAVHALSSIPFTGGAQLKNICGSAPEITNHH